MMRATSGTARGGSGRPVMMMASVADVAAEIRGRIPGVGKLKLHKLLYYCQGYHLAMQGRPLFSESISAWDMGPVVGTFWHDEEHGEKPGDAAVLSNRELNTIGYVLSQYGHMSGNQLSAMAHSEPPFQQADRHRPKRASTPMPPAGMQGYFESVLDRDRPAVDEQELRQFLAGAVRRGEAPVRADSVEEIRRLAARA